MRSLFRRYQRFVAVARRRVSCALLCILPLLLLAAPVFAEDYEGKTIRKISFATAEGLSYEDLSFGLPIHPGGELTAKELRSAVDTLMRRNIFIEVDAEVIAVEDGVDVNFHCISTYSVSEVQFEGGSTFEDSQLRRFLALRSGTTLDLAALAVGRERLIKAYRRAGHDSATVSAVVSERGIRAQVKVLIRIDEGPRTTIGSLKLRGAVPQEAEPAVNRIRERVEGTPFTERTRREVKRELLTALRAEGFLQAVVDDIPPETRAASSADASDSEEQLQRDLEFEIDARDPVSLQFEGSTQFTPEELLAPLRIETRSVPFTPAAFTALCRSIVDMYQERGYLFARADVKELPPEGIRKRYLIEVDEGVKVRIKSIRFVGNTVFSSRKLRRLMTVRPEGNFLLKRWYPGYLVNDELSEDLTAIEALYERAGYPGTTVSFDLLPSLSEPVLDIVITIREARAKKLTAVELELEGSFSRSEGLSELLSVETSVKEGDILNTEILRDEVRKLNESLADLGYPAATVRLELDSFAARARYVVNPGTQVRVGAVWLAGNRLTHDRLIRRELLFKEGELLRNTHLRDTEDALIRTGFFRSVSINAADGALDEPVEDLLVTVSERDTGAVELEASVNSEDGLHLKSELGQRNFEGIGDGINFGIDGYLKSGSSRIFDKGTARALYTRRHIFDSSSDLLIEGFAQYDLQLNDSFAYDRVGMSASFVRILDERIKGTAGYQFFNENLFDVPEDVQIGEDDTGTTRYSSLFGRAELDLRDSPHNPRRGSRVLGEVFADPAFLGSEANIAGATLQGNYYLPVADEWVWVQSLRGTIVEPFGDTDVVPVSHRLFLGGRNSLRGFSRNVIGPRGALLNIVGGDSSVVLNNELQWEISESFITVGFLDVGQAFLRNSGDFTGDGLGIDDLRFSPGMGFRYKTPIGPISIDVGIALDREFGERVGRINFGIGNPF